ncbi:A disintegrin and metalloproteinase with thrombospondin motifs 8 isoform X1 [Syngnathus scovelli]|uniref:A disintegrin and metalloproteinase with thrombospondin motifs 8 isoform X1 n=1 Tax=Syngnathus scovelli TaxID=161590 RepID=UPI0021107304|nr:A disintegrin and metalloproteinase with thrombospondin motifs 8 isoform X1 [Syngnathus scovelli]
MCPVVCLLLLCVFHPALSTWFESEDVVPVRINGRVSGRFWKRSEDQARIILSAFGKELTLNLVPDTSFISPYFTIQRLRAKDLGLLRSTSGAQPSLGEELHNLINQTNESGGQLRSCFYSGNVDQDQHSLVALSLCSGVYGSFITEGTEYLIEPKFRGGFGSHAEQLHLIKRRTLPKSHGVPFLFDHAVEASGPEKHKLESFTRDGSDAPREPRRRRFVSAPRFIETLAVADSSMAHFYGDEIKHYILTLMSMAAQLYKHPSIKNSVNLVVVKLLVVEDEEVGPEVSSNGGVALRNFCSWQQLFNTPSQRHPEHYDTAMLFTREDICGQKSCDTLGVADVGTMCDPKRSCSVIEDNGLQAAFTAAHELGHVLSMPHDDSKTCERLFGDLGGHYLMAPLFVSLHKTMPWSPCSVLYITEFFDNGHGDCLLDFPESSLPLPKELPGIKYNLDHQCQQIFGEEFYHCPNTTDSDICSQLWCQEDGTSQCSTKNGSLPWADGTPCSLNRTCLHGVCMPTKEVLQPLVVVDGGWSTWGPWQQCSRTCGGGVEFSYRECTNPEPQNGGNYCEGQRVQYQSCNTQPCDNNGKSYREEQCEKYNSPNYLDYNGNIKHWIPKYAGVSPRDRCKLFCRARGSNEFKVFESKVIDGTPCGPDTTSVCVQGQCVKAGCDQVIGSNKRVDKCGVCGGNGLTCRKITGSYNKAIYGYSDIVTIPVGATNIDIKQRSHRGIKHDGNYLAIMRESGSYILNGNFSVSTMEQDIPVLGAVLKYSGSSTTLERIQSFMRLKEAIIIQLLATVGDSSPPKVKYSFFIPRDVALKSKAKKGSLASLHVIHPFSAPDWVLGEWSECSKSCGSGWSRRNVECRDSAGFLTSLCDKDLKPMDIRACGDQPCPIWQMGPWSACSRTCGQGERRRSIFCIDYTGKTVEPEKCDLNKKPAPVSGECFNLECL